MDVAVQSATTRHLHLTFPPLRQPSRLIPSLPAKKGKAAGPRSFSITHMNSAEQRVPGTPARRPARSLSSIPKDARFEREGTGCGRALSGLHRRSVRNLTLLDVTTRI